MRVIAFVVCLATTGCTQGVLMCGVKPLGQDQRGITYVLAQCEPHEQAAE
jgi:hypothetical protein